MDGRTRPSGSDGIYYGRRRPKGSDLFFFPFPKNLLESKKKKKLGRHRLTSVNSAVLLTSLTAAAIFAGSLPPELLICPAEMNRKKTRQHWPGEKAFDSEGRLPRRD